VKFNPFSVLSHGPRPALDTPAEVDAQHPEAQPLEAPAAGKVVCRGQLEALERCQEGVE
jgi:hypothetical protein